MEANYVIFKLLTLLLTNQPETAALECMSKNIYFEARDQPIEGQIAVAQVVMNRVASDRYPDSHCEVVHQPSQFSWYWDGKSDKPKDVKAYMLASIVAIVVMEQAIPNIVPNILYYHEKSILPYWAEEATPVSRIEDHIFYNKLN